MFYFMGKSRKRLVPMHLDRFPVVDESRVGLISDRNMEAQADHQVTKRYRLLYGISSGLGLLLFVLVLVWIIVFRKGFGLDTPSIEFNWHPMLMLGGFILTYSQSMLVFRSARFAKKKILKLWHAGLHIVAFILAVLGLKAVFDSHNFASPPVANLYTLHSWIGILTIILFSYQFLGGFTSFLFPGLSQNLRSIYLPIHVSFGSAIFFMAVITAMMGFTEKALWAIGNDYANLPSEAVLVNCIGVILVAFGALVLYLANDPAYKRFAIPEDEMSLASHTADTSY